MRRGRGISKGCLDEIEPTAIQPKVADGPATRNKGGERSAENLRRAFRLKQNGIERGNELVELASRGDGGSADLLRQRPPADRERCDRIPPSQMVTNMCPFPGSGRRVPLHPDGVDGGTQRPLAECEEAEHRFVGSEAADDAGDLLGCGAKALGKLNGKAEVPLPLASDRSGILGEAPDKVDEAVLAGREQHILSQRLQPGSAIGEVLGAAQGPQLESCLKRSGHVLQGRDPHSDRGFARRSLGKVDGPDQIVVEPREDIAVRQVVDGGKDAVDVFEAGSQGEAGRAQGGDVFVPRCRLGGGVARTVLEPAMPRGRVRNPPRELGGTLVTKGGGELAECEPLDLGVDSFQPAPEPHDRRFQVTDQPCLLRRLDALDHRLQEANRSF